MLSITLGMWESYVLEDRQTDFPTPSHYLFYAWEPLLLQSEFPYLYNQGIFSFSLYRLKFLILLKLQLFLSFDIFYYINQ